MARSPPEMVHAVARQLAHLAERWQALISAPR